MATDLHEFLVKHRITAQITVSNELLRNPTANYYLEGSINETMAHAFSHQVVRSYGMTVIQRSDSDGYDYHLSLYVFDSKQMEQLIAIVTKKAKEDMK